MNFLVLNNDIDIKIQMNDYYTYAYLREDSTPYYIGKGKDKRLYYKYGKNCKPPKDRSRIIKLKQNLTEAEAFKHEIYMIAVFGKKCDGTGILMNIADGGNAPPKMYGDNSPTKKPEVKAKIGAANKKSLKGRKISEDARKKLSNTWKEKLKNNPRPLSYYEKNLKKMAERNRTDKEKHKKHSEFMKNQSYASKPVEYNNKIYKSMSEAIKETGLSRYIILKQGGKIIKGIK
ncbi:hypothetical protein PQC13_gp035 [Synechococcus phage S-SRM01]|uniref:GIY-YIG domain-containing protein n=1 Tax=Synechococcus phage S-SRM01 TaxID=2781608 RepID=A0A879R3S7_9CAUD|nr:hypothetical protein PQC13_gp035 [Synechococcus phage S-SRM01]QPX48000.1 hypothetical protein [Synechococcus phage S-SRM01]